ncbi:GTP cyclohydrolase I [Plasmodium gonderi]|uniref:GTP cyclohydrolase 1 n=1 Tax=Plasmodium gonderi TaxID=77519 RepID=A0A1Y1JM02_PLAGO|nr:GTP cyclohydrolase I [Plasmodium gonderi]GAW83616.1 GTP cyclohydrolase I [Plasmodium gonderi]
MLKRRDLTENKKSGLDKLDKFGQRSCRKSKEVQNFQLIDANGNDNKKEAFEYKQSTNIINRDLDLGFRVQNIFKENKRSYNNLNGNKDDYIPCTSQEQFNIVDQDKKLSSDGVHISKRSKRMIDDRDSSITTNDVSEDEGLNKIQGDLHANLKEKYSHNNNLLSIADVEMQNGSISIRKRKIIKRENERSGRDGSGRSDSDGSDSDENYHVTRDRQQSRTGCRDSKARERTKKEEQILDISKNIYNILQLLKIPPNDILKRTSRRFAETFLYLTNGYNMNIEKIIKKSLYKRKYKNNSSIKITGIHIYSLCKHHLLPFEGICNIEYMPNKYIMGLSKFSRIIDVFSRRLQLQEDLTNSICDALKKYLKPKNINVNIVAKHLCINMRGVKEHDATTITNVYYELKNNKYVKCVDKHNCVPNGLKAPCRGDHQLVQDEMAFMQS